MPEADADKPWFNPFDLTKVWPHGDYPLIEVGVVELNRNPENYFAEVEQSSFSPANQVPGISHSPDKMLQFRIFSYADAHRYLLGVNYETLPVNQAQCPAHSYHRDGAMRHDGNNGGAVNYEPNSFNGPTEDHKFIEPPLKVYGDADRYNHRDGNDDYKQPGDLFRLMTPEQQQRLIGNLVRAMMPVPREIQLRQIGHFLKAEPAYGEGVARGLGIDVAELEEAPLPSLPEGDVPGPGGAHGEAGDLARVVAAKGEVPGAAVEAVGERRRQRDAAQLAVPEDKPAVLHAECVFHGQGPHCSTSRRTPRALPVPAAWARRGGTSDGSHRPRAAPAARRWRPS